MSDFFGMRPILVQKRIAFTFSEMRNLLSEISIACYVSTVHLPQNEQYQLIGIFFSESSSVVMCIIENIMIIPVLPAIQFQLFNNSPFTSLSG